MEPFDLIPLASPSNVDKAWGKDAEENAFIELHNLIAAAERPGDFGPRDLRRISRRHGVDLATAFSEARRRMYRNLLLHLIDTERLDAEGRKTLSHLARTLHLERKQRQTAHQIVFGVKAIEAVEDNDLDPEERTLLDHLKDALHLDPELAKRAYDNIAADRIMDLIGRACEDNVITSREAKEIEKAFEHLDVTMPTSLRQRLSSGTL